MTDQKKVLWSLPFLLMGAPFIALGSLAALVWLWVEIGWYKTRKDGEQYVIDVSEASERVKADRARKK